MKKFLPIIVLFGSLLHSEAQPTNFNLLTDTGITNVIRSLLSPTQFNTAGTPIILTNPPGGGSGTNYYVNTGAISNYTGFGTNLTVRTNLEVQGRLYINGSNITFASSKVAIGNGTSTNGDFSISIGESSVATNSASIAIGYETIAANDLTVAIGASVVGLGSDNVLIGYNVQDAGYNNVVGIGGGSAYAGESYATAIGYATAVSAPYGTALGSSSLASGDYGLAVGFNAKATAVNSTAVGPYASATQVNQFTLGRTNQYIYVPGMVYLGLGMYVTNDINTYGYLRAEDGIEAIPSGPINLSQGAIIAGSSDFGFDAVGVGSLNGLYVQNTSYTEAIAKSVGVSDFFLFSSNGVPHVKWTDSVGGMHTNNLLAATATGDVTAAGNNVLTGSNTFSGPVYINDMIAETFTVTTLSVTNAFELLQIDDIPTNNIPATSTTASVTNWFFINKGGIPTLVATNYSAGGWLEKALYP